MSLICEQSHLSKIVTKNLDRLLQDKEKEFGKTLSILIEALTGLPLDNNLYGKLVALTKVAFEKEEKLGYKLLLKCVSKLHNSFLPGLLQMVSEQATKKQEAKPVRL